MGVRNFRNLLLTGAVLATAALNAAPASAVIVDFGFNPNFSSLSYQPSAGSLANATSINGWNTVTGYAVNTIGGDDQTGVVGGSAVVVNLPSNFAFTQGLQSIAPVTKSFTGSGGAYNVTFNQLFATSDPVHAPGNLAWVLIGTLTLPSALTQPDFLSASFTNVGGGGQTTNVSFTETSTRPPVLTPEPASMAVLGIGLLGLGAARRRKR